MLIDYRAILIAIRYWEVKPFIVSNTDYRNTFMNVQGIVDYNTFFNAVAFVTGDVDFFNESDGYVAIYVSNIGNPTVYGDCFINGKPLRDYLPSPDSVCVVVPKYSYIKGNDTTNVIYSGVIPGTSSAISTPIKNGTYIGDNAIEINDTNS